MKLTEKLLLVMQECARIGKDAVNSDANYQYVSAAKINDAVNRALIKNGIATTAESKLLDTRIEGKNFFATVEVTITLHNVESDETLKITGIGSGIDTLDKSVAKAQTMAAKYAWKNTLHICDASDDPDAVKGVVQYTNSEGPLEETLIPF